MLIWYEIHFMLVIVAGTYAHEFLNIKKYHFRMKVVSALQSLANGVLFAFEQQSRIAHIEDERFLLTIDGSYQRIIKFSFGLAIFLMIALMVLIIISWYFANNSGSDNMKTSMIYNKKKGLCHPNLLLQ